MNVVAKSVLMAPWVQMLIAFGPEEGGMIKWQLWK